MGVFTGTLLGAEGEREQVTLSCSVDKAFWHSLSQAGGKEAEGVGGADNSSFKHILFTKDNIFLPDNFYRARVATDRLEVTLPVSE